MDIEYALQIANLSENLAKEYIANKELEKAIDCLKMSLDMKTIFVGEESEEVKSIVQQIEELKQ